MTDSVVTAFQAQLVVVDGGTYAVESATMTFSGQGMNTMSVVVNVGITRTANQTALFFQRGQQARLQIINGSIVANRPNNVYGSLFPQNLNLFRGVIEDFGPVQISPGVFALQVLVHGRMLWLATDSLNASGIKSNQYTDTSNVYNDRFGEILPEFALDPEIVQQDLALALKTSFTAIAGVMDDPLTASDYAPQGSLARTILDVFGGNANSDVKSTLQGISGSLLWRNITTPDSEQRPLTPQIVAAISSRLNEALTYDWYGETYFTRYQNIGSSLYFRILEVSNDIRVVPYVPFYRSIDAYPILPNTYSSVQWVINTPKSCRGVVLTSGQGTDTDPDKLILGIYKRLGNPTGAVYVMQAPSILMSNVAPDRLEDDTGKVARAVTADVGDLGEKFAKFYTWANNYENRTLRVQCPTLRTDIGPLEAVRVDFPATADFVAGLESPAMYGSVSSVTITLDATRGQAVTTYDINYVRSYRQQLNEIDPDINAHEHPFFTRNYYGGRLDSNVARPISGGVSTGGTLTGF